MRIRPLLVLACALGLSVASIAPSGAHTEVQSSTPSPGEVVADRVDSVELVFLDPVLPSVTITVRSVDGAPVEDLGSVVHADGGRVASVGFAPLAARGAYVVEYSFVAVDGDAQSDVYRFTIASTSTDSGVRSTLLGVGIGVGFTAAVAVAMWRRTRRA